MRRLGFVIVAIALMVAACGQASEPDDQNAGGAIGTITPLEPSDGPTSVDPADGTALDQLIAGNTQLALDLFSILASDGENMLLAPASISEGLALPYLGARGETATEMAEVLSYQLDDDELYAAMATLRTALESRQNDKLELAVANRAFGQEGLGFADEYLADLSRWFEAPLATVNFGNAEAARMEINDWTAEQTNDHIPELFPKGSVKANTRLALVNAVYLKAEWLFPFNSEGTELRPFELSDGSEVEVEMMSFNEFLPSGSGAAWSAVQLPYAGEEMSMVVVVPTNLERFRKNLDAAKIDRIRFSIDDGGIHLLLPKFEMSSHTSLVGPLMQMGLSRPFGPSADFGGMTGSSGLFIDAIEHETFIKVDEEGTEAAGATGTLMALSHGPKVYVNRPFVFWIQDDATGAILFLGQVTDPRG